MSEEFVKSGLERNGGGAGSAMLVVDNAHYTPIVLSTGLPCEIPLSRLPDPHSVPRPLDADRWKEEVEGNAVLHGGAERWSLTC